MPHSCPTCKAFHLAPAAHFHGLAEREVMGVLDRLDAIAPPSRENVILFPDVVHRIERETGVPLVRATGLRVLEMDVRRGACYATTVDDCDDGPSWHDTEDLLGRIHLDDAPRVSEAIDEALSLAGTFSISYRARFRDDAPWALRRMRASARESTRLAMVTTPVIAPLYDVIARLKARVHACGCRILIEVLERPPCPACSKDLDAIREAEGRPAEVRVGASSLYFNGTSYPSRPLPPQEATFEPKRHRGHLGVKSLEKL